MNKFGILRYLLALCFLSSAIQAYAHEDCRCSPEYDWRQLLKGNKNFVQDPEYAEERAELVHGQNPHYAILSCSDSRVPPEIVFDQGLGDLFVARVAGNVTEPVVVDTLEFAVETFDITTLIVMGHTDCGAVIGALEHLRRNGGRIDQPRGDHLNAVLIPIEKAIVSAGIDIYAPNALELATRANIVYQAEQLIKRSPPIERAIAKGRLILVGAEYHLRTGHVEQLFIVDCSNCNSNWHGFKKCNYVD